jgi:hypothetical protein
MTTESTHLTPDQLKTTVDAAAAHFSLIRKKYPKLDAYVVFCIPGAQTSIHSSPGEIMKELSAMVVDSAAKTEAKALLKNLKDKDISEDDKKKLTKEFNALSKDFLYHTTPFVELRFGNLDYDLIEQLRTDELTNRELTPQTKASIRIVLGTVASFMG